MTDRAAWRQALRRLPARRRDRIGSGMHPEEEVRPRRADALWTWRKIAVLVASLLAMAILLLWDFER